jgi:outer membrane receptor for ferrienterochelin and colicins
MLLVPPLVAQQGAITGRVTNATTLAPIPLARISVVGRGDVQVVSESDGSFELRLDAGLYDLVVEASDFAATRFDRVAVTAGQTTARNLPLESQGYRLAGFIVTASRLTASSGAIDTEITAPSSSHSISSREIAARPAVSSVEHLRGLSAVDVMTQGVQASNVVVRGFNNIFSGALHMLTDNRLAGLPSLRVNFLHFVPSTDDDIDRAEVVLGPGSALYGPNTTNGVLHLITKSPLESPGTTVSVTAGERSVFQTAFRSAFLINQSLGLKFSGQFFRGQEWPYVDPTEAENAATDPAECQDDRISQGLSGEEAATACGRIGKRDPWARRYGMEARADWRFSERGTLITTYGRMDASGIELTGLSAVQTDNWVHEFVQARLSYDRWFVQAYVNTNDAEGAYLLRDGLGLVDHSSLAVVQVQNAFDVAGGRLDFTYGWDYFETRPDSRGTIYGHYEGENDMREWGAYLQSKAALSPKVDLIAAGRIDAHSILPAKVLSPRLALVVKPTESNAIRLSYNRAFSTPTALNYFLDIGAGPMGGGYTLRAFGSGRNGFAWQNADGSLRGMRSPFIPAGALLPVNAQTLWQLAVGVAPSRVELDQQAMNILQALTPGTNDVGIRYEHAITGSGGPLSELVLPDVEPIEESTTDTFEAGWTGVWENRVRISADVYYQRRRNFVSPLTVENPLLLLDHTGMQAWLESTYAPARSQDLVDRLGLTPEAAAERAMAEAAELAAGLAEVPLAVVSSDAPQLANGGADLIATYRNLGTLDLWGADVALQWTLDQRWSLGATYSRVSENWFELDGGATLALNAPRHKATLSIAYRDEVYGVDASARVRYTGPFPVASTAFEGIECISHDPDDEGCIDEYALIDLVLGYRVPRTAFTMQVAVSNALNTGYRSFVGVPTVGRLALVRIKYDLF